MGYSEEPQVTFTIVNRDLPTITRPNFAGLLGDARDLSAVADNSFDVAFSNSTIEHVGSYSDQQRMAKELRRIAPRYFVQTPYKYFPIEQHWMLPLVQFAPFEVRYQVAKRFGTGAFADLSDDEAIEVSSVRLLTVRELQRLFPEAVLVRETVFGVPKSLMVHYGF